MRRREAESMARCLFVVEDAFFIKGRGVVPLPGLVPQGEERFRVGDPIAIVRPDGTRLEWTIGGFEMIHRAPSTPRNDVPILLRGLNKEDVPVGSEVWSVDEQPRFRGPGPPRESSSRLDHERDLREVRRMTGSLFAPVRSPCCPPSPVPPGSVGSRCSAPPSAIAPTEPACRRATGRPTPPGPARCRSWRRTIGFRFRSMVRSRRVGPSAAICGGLRPCQ